MPLRFATLRARARARACFAVHALVCPTGGAALPGYTGSRLNRACLAPLTCICPPPLVCALRPAAHELASESAVPRACAIAFEKKDPTGALSHARALLAAVT